MAEKKSKINEEFEKINKMRDELMVKLDEVYKKGGITYDEIERFLNNPQNFTEKQWKLLQEQREMYQEKLNALVGKKNSEKRDKSLKKKTSEERSRKTLGSRKKWIPMR